MTGGFPEFMTGERAGGPTGVGISGLSGGITGASCGIGSMRTRLLAVLVALQG